MKKITVVTPCYNEENNVHLIVDAVQRVFSDLPQYQYEHLFIDNCSTDKTTLLLRSLASKHPHIKVIINTRNFGPVRSPYYGILQGDGDAVVIIAADLQEPPALIKQFVAEWEKGYKIVAGIKTESHESALMFFFRKLYYRFISKISDIKLTRNFTGFALYDKKVIDLMRKIDDPYPYLRGLVSELGFKMAEVPYTQPIRQHGSSKANLYVLYDWVMLGITSHSKLPIRLTTMAGFLLSFVSLGMSVVFLILKLLFWSSFSLGVAPILIGVFFFASIQLFCIGLLGEYIISIHTRIMNRPLVIEEERINFET